MSGNDRERKNAPIPEPIRAVEHDVPCVQGSRPTAHYIRILPSGKQDGQSSGNQASGASDKSSSSQSGEKPSGDKS